MFKKAFTMAEILIVLAIIGVVVAICTPIILSTIPDQNEAKARKAYNTFANSVSSMLNSGEYYDGDFLHNLDGADLKGGSRTFCIQLSNQLNTVIDYKKRVSNESCIIDNALPNSTRTTDPSTMDAACVKRTEKFAFKTADGIYWYGMVAAFAEQDTPPKYNIVCIDTDPGDPNVLPYSMGVDYRGKIAIGERLTKILDKEGLNE